MTRTTRPAAPARAGSRSRRTLGALVALAVVATAGAPSMLTVRPGDTLWAIAEVNYGNGSEFPNIVRANPSQITDPDLIFPGQVLKIPIGA